MTDEVQRIADRHGPMPPAIHSPPSASSVSLPDPRLDGDLFDLLRKRCTTREFSGQGLDAETLSTLLHHVFGCVAERKTAVGPLLRKTSPSGGSLHPIEVYPLVINVRGVEPGLYHYNVGRHGLGQMESMPQAEAADLAQRFAAGQPFAGGGSVLFILAARFGRTFWKYRQHAKAYRVVMMDVGHLSQTFYMTCAHLGLGAFFTAAVNEECIQERLGFEDGAQDALAVMGTGVPSI
jgi:putative peptide maturation dehydrogenase